MLKIGRNKHQWRDLEADGESPWRRSCKSEVVILSTNKWKDTAISSQIRSPGELLLIMSDLLCHRGITKRSTMVAQAC
jgi:hypothetical protein